VQGGAEHELVEDVELELDEVVEDVDDELVEEEEDVDELFVEDVDVDAVDELPVEDEEVLEPDEELDELLGEADVVDTTSGLKTPGTGRSEDEEVLLCMLAATADVEEVLLTEDVNAEGGDCGEGALLFEVLEG
jgi:hypothetical protein